MPKQLNLLGRFSNNIGLKVLLESNSFYFWLGQLIFFIVYTAFLWLTTPNKYFDIVVFPGIAQFGLNSLSFGVFPLILVRLSVFLLFNMGLIFFAYRFSKLMGTWFLQNVLIFVILINFIMLSYW